MKEKIISILNGLRDKNLTPEEKAVINCLIDAWKDGGRKITQDYISRSVRWLGVHQKFEKQYGRETTLRKVRQVIHDLRVKHGAPVISDRNGYWIPKTEQEIGDYLSQLEMTAKAQTRAWFETYSAMKKVFGVTSSYFESQRATPLFSTKSR